MTPDRVYLSLFEYHNSLALWLALLDAEDDWGWTTIEVDTVNAALDVAYEWWPLSVVGSDGDLDIKAALDVAADPAREADAATALGDLFLTEGVARIAESTDSDERPQFIVNPSVSLATIPWELLALPGDGRRLVELFDVRTAVPSTVVGAGRPQAALHPDDAAYVIDPVTRLGSVLPADCVAAWEERIGPAPWAPQEFIDRASLKDYLAIRRPGRLTFFGHCLPAAEDASAAGIMLSDHAGVPGATEAVKGGRPLSAHDLLADYEWGNSEELQSEKWWMPPHVALVACGSGLDQAFPEPLGMVAALMERGAEVVMASRWTLPSDVLTRGATTELGMAVDDALSGHAPVAELNAWKRRKLAEWKTDPCLANSPVLWASIAAYQMPGRV